MKSVTPEQPADMVTGEDRGWVEKASQRLGRDLFDWMSERRQPANPFDRAPGFRRLAAELEQLHHIKISRHALWTFWHERHDERAAS